MPVYQTAHTSVPGAAEAEAYGIPPVMYQPRNPYASSAYVTDGNGVSPLIGYPSQYPHVIHYTPRPRMAYAPVPRMVDAMALIQAAAPMQAPTSILGTPVRPRGTGTGAPTSQPKEQTSNQTQQTQQQTSPGVYNGRVNIGDNLRLSDVSLGGVPPTLPPTAPTAPAQPVAAPEPMNYSNRLLRDLYGNAPDLVGSPDPEVVQDPATVAPAPATSQRTSVAIPSAPVTSQAEFMTQVETAPMAQGNVVDTQTLSDASGTVQDVVRAMMAPYYNLFQQGSSFGRALGRELRNPTVTQAGVTPIPGVATPVFMIP